MKRRWCRWTRCWERKRVLSHIWVKSESDLDQILTRSLTSSNQSWYARNINLLTQYSTFWTVIIFLSSNSFALILSLRLLQSCLSCKKSNKEETIWDLNVVDATLTLFFNFTIWESERFMIIAIEERVMYT